MTGLVGLRKTVLLGLVGLSVLTPVLVLAGDGWTNKTSALRKELSNRHPKNVILLIGDGMDDSAITMARNYSVGAAGRLALDTLPLTGDMTTYAVQEANPALPEYVPESASTASGWSTGYKTSNGRISTAAGTDADLKTILEYAQDEDRRVGNVTTAELTDATPAAAASHVRFRACQGPLDMATCPQDKKSAGGPGSIAEQLVDHEIDVLLGGGKQRFDQLIDGGPDAGKTVVASAEDKGYSVVGTAAALDTIEPGEKVLGLFSSGNMSLEWGGELAQPFPGSGPQRCIEGRRPAEQPALAAMTAKAIELLENKRGFFLQVEGASIDKQAHASNPCGQIGEHMAFDAAVQVALDYQEDNPDTLIIVTGDHAHTPLIIPEPTNPTQPGAFSRLITAEGVTMTVSYATSPVGASQEHTGGQIRIAAKGPLAGNVVGLVDQTEIFDIIVYALELNQD